MSALVQLTPPCLPVILKGVTINPQNPFHMNFILDKGDLLDVSHPEQGYLEADAKKLINYFLAALTIPEDALWVNLSPLEKDRIIPDELGVTQMGEDMLTQDYLLKRLTSSLIHPDDALGKQFWDEVYAQAYEKYGSINIDVDTFNKVWIVADKAEVYEKGQTALVVKGEMDVLLEEDYEAAKASSSDPLSVTSDQRNLSTAIMREIILPAIKKEVNHGKNFEQLRQIYHSLILATWFKRKLKQSVVYQQYIDQNKVSGIEIEDKQMAEKVYQSYLKSFQEGVYDFIQEEYDPASQQVIPRKYFSGGVTPSKNKFGNSLSETLVVHEDYAVASDLERDSLFNVDINVRPYDEDFAQAVKIREELNDFIGPSNGTKKLVWSEDSNVIDYHLRQIAKERNLPYLRVTLRDQDDFNRLLIDLTIKDGQVDKKPGKLKRRLAQKSIIFIDYTHSDPKFVEALNSIFDKDPYFMSEPVHPDVILVGNIRDEQLEKYPISFYSRFQGHKDLKGYYQDPIDAIEEVDEDVYLPNAGMVGVDFFGDASPRFIYDQLIGSYHVDEQGSVEVVPGSIIAVIRKNQKEGKNQPLVIQDGRWDDPYLSDLLRQIMFDGEVTFNDETVKIPEGFQIKKQKVDRTKKVDGFKLVTPEEATKEGELWIINSQNQDVLWSHTKISEDNRLVATKGVLGMVYDKPVRLRIVGNLEDWMWNRLMQFYHFSEIEVAPGVVLPSKVQRFMSKGLKKLHSSQKPQSWEETKETLKAQDVLVIESTDLEFARTKLEEELGDENIVYPVTTETSFQDLVNATDVEILGDNQKIFKTRLKQVLQELQNGKTVILEGVDTNESLYRELETALSEDPYIYSNGERISLKDLPGQLIMTLRKDSDIQVRAHHYASIEATPKNYQEQLKKEFPDIFQEKDFDKIIKIYQLLEDLPAPTPGLYTEKPVLDLSRLRLLYWFRKGKNWLDAFERVVIPGYIESSEVAAYLRVQIRLAFNEEYEGQSENSIHGKKFVAAQNALPQGIDWKTRFWELSDTLSLDLLKKQSVSPGTIFTEPRTQTVFDLIQEALIYKHQGTLKEKMYRSLFQNQEEITQAAMIDDTLSVPELNWQELRDQIIYAFGITRGVMLKGSPGTGKSFITDEIARELHYRSDQIFGPITTGTDTKETDILSRTELKDQKTVAKKQLVANWAMKGSLSREIFYKYGLEDEYDNLVEKLIRYGHIENDLTVQEPSSGFSPDLVQELGASLAEKVERILVETWENRGGILIVDEANLPRSEFWNFLKGVFSEKPYVWINGEKKFLTDRHVFVFTGNQETLEDRKYIELVERYMVTVPFSRFSRSFIHKRTDEYIKKKGMKDNRDQLVDAIVDLHCYFQEKDPRIEFSLRDVQDLSDRMNIFQGAEWTMEGLVNIAWENYKGYFSLEQQKALHFLLAEKYGVEVEAYQDAKNKRIREEWGESFLNEAGISLVDSSAEMVGSILDFMKVREQRILGNTRIQGKRGIVYEGFSGRGKDAVPLQTLKSLGMVDGDQEFREVDGTQKYYRLNGSFDTDEIVAKIEKAKKEGSLVIISEANLLRSGFLEGKLNDLLTGNAHQGFAIMIPINSVDFGAREKFSSALQNRIIYKRIVDYTEEEFLQIGQDRLKRDPALQNFPEEDARHIVRAHLWIKDQIENQRYHPTTRDLLRAFDQLSRSFNQGKIVDGKEVFSQENMSFEDMLTSVYGVFLNKVFKGKTLPSREFLVNEYHPSSQIDMEKVQEYMGSFLIPKVWGPVKVRYDASCPYATGGSLSLNPGTTPTYINYQTGGLQSGRWIEVTFHESAHARAGRRFSDHNYYSYIADNTLHPMNDLVQDMDDLQDMSIFVSQYTNSTVRNPVQSDILFAEMIERLDTDLLFSWMINPADPLTRRKMFQRSLLGYAKGLFSSEQLLEFAAHVDGVIDEVNPFELALNHLDTVKEIAELVPQVVDGKMAEEEILTKKFEAILLVETMEKDFLSIPFDDVEMEEPSDEQQQIARSQGVKALNHIDWKVQNRKKFQHRKSTKKLTPEEMEAKKNRLEEVKYQRQEASRDLILEKLTAMRKELQHPFGITTARLKEMQRELEDETFYLSYARRIKQLNDDFVNEHVQKFLTQIKERMEQPPMSAEQLEHKKNLAALGLYPGLKEEDFQLIQPKYGYSADVSGQGLRMDFTGGFGAHSSQLKDRSNPVEVSPPPVTRAQDIVLTTKETVQRNPMLESMTTLMEGDLSYVLDFLHSTKLETDKVYGTRGTFDIYEFLFGDSTRAWVSSGGVPTKQKKEIVLTGDLKDLQWNPILEELFHFLFSKKFKVTVYLSEYSFLDNISTLSDLKNIMRKTVDVKVEDMAKDLLKRKSRSDFELIDVRELQKKIEEVYTYIAFKTVIEGDDGVQSSEVNGKNGQAESSVFANMPLDEQVNAIQEILSTSGISNFLMVSIHKTKGAVKIRINDGVSGISIPASDLQAKLLNLFIDLSKIPLIESIIFKGNHFSGGKFADKVDVLSLLKVLPNLKEIDLRLEDVEEDSVTAFYKAYAGREKLNLIWDDPLTARAWGYSISQNSGTKQYFIVKEEAMSNNVLEVEDITSFVNGLSQTQSMKKQLNFKEQIKEAERIMVQEAGLPASAVSWDDTNGESIVLDLSQLQKKFDLSLLKRLTFLTTIKVKGEKSHPSILNPGIHELYDPQNIFSLEELMSFMLHQGKVELLMKVKEVGKPGFYSKGFNQNQIKKEVLYEVLGNDASFSFDSMRRVDIVFNPIANDVHEEIIRNLKKYGITRFGTWDIAQSGSLDLDLLYEMEEIENIKVNNFVAEKSIVEFLSIDPGKNFGVETPSFGFSFIYNGKDLVIEKHNNATGKNETIPRASAKTGAQDVVQESEFELLDRVIKSLVDQKGTLRGVRSRLSLEGVVEEFDKILEKVSLDAGLKEEILQEDAALAVNVSSSSLVSGEEEVGGVDFNPANLKLDVKGESVQFSLPQGDATNAVIIDGVIPVIINITPIINLQLYLGKMNNETETYQEISRAGDRVTF